MAKREGEPKIIIDPGLLAELFAPVADDKKPSDATSSVSGDAVMAPATGSLPGEQAEAELAEPGDGAQTEFESTEPGNGEQPGVASPPDSEGAVFEPAPRAESAPAGAPESVDEPPVDPGLAAEQPADSEEPGQPMFEEAQPGEELAEGEPCVGEPGSAKSHQEVPAEEQAADAAASGAIEEDTAAPGGDSPNEDLVRKIHEAAEETLRAGRFDEAVERFSALSWANPGCWSAHFNLGLAREKAGQLDEAAAAFEAAIKTAPPRWEAHHALGICRLRAEHPDEALRAFDNAIGCSSDAIEPKVARALALHLQGRFPEAREQYAALCEQGAATLEVLANLTRLCLAGGDVEEAGRWGDRLLETAPGCSLTELAMADIGFHQKDLTGAARCLRRVTRSGDAGYEQWFNLGLVLAESGHQEEACAAYRKAILIDHDRAEAHANLGVVLQSLYRLPAAQECYEQALALAPDHPGLLWNLAVVAAERGDQDVAQEALGRLVAIRPRWKPARDALAKLRQQGQPPR